MGYISEPTGRISRWGIPLAESYGVQLPADYGGEAPVSPFPPHSDSAS